MLAHLNGRLLPFGWAKTLYWKRKIDKVRVFALGVKPEYQPKGAAARFYQMHFDAAERTPQKGGEMGWILEKQQTDEPRHGGHGRRGSCAATACTSACSSEAGTTWLVGQ